MGAFPRRDLLLQALARPQLVVCYKAKDLLRTALQRSEREIDWKQGRPRSQIHMCVTRAVMNTPSTSLALSVAGCRIQDPQVSGWLLDPANPCSCYQDLLRKYCKRPSAAAAAAAHGAKKKARCDVLGWDVDVGKCRNTHF